MQRYQEPWNTVWRDLGVTHLDAALLPALVQRYSEPQRKYHTLQHLDACLGHFADLRAQAQRPAEVALALWFHDAIYDVGVPGNELKSADWARDALSAAGVHQDTAQRVHDLVMVTCHDVFPQTRDQQVLLDVDLAILGAAPAVFEVYEQQIRAEYASVAQDLFQSRRRRILQQFLDRPKIYHTPQFYGQYETQARANLANSVHRLVE